MLILRPSAATETDFSRRLEFLRNMARPDPNFVQQVGEAIRAEFRQNFAAESSGFGRWAALAESTVLDRLRGGFGAGPILNRSGGYEASWVDADDADHVSEIEALVGGWRLSEGSSHPLTGFHQQGTSRMPARPVNEIDASGEIRIAYVVETAIFRMLTQR